MQQTISIVILSYNRPESILRNVREILANVNSDVELIVVDNCSEIPVVDVLDDIAGVRVIRLEENIGVAGRNVGILGAKSDVVITLDDDVFGITCQHILKVREKFHNDEKLAAINFKVIDDVTQQQINWCHHRKMEEWGDDTFLTYEISEGAVALRRNAFIESGMYPDYFFISHEGPDLALRMMNSGFDVLYSPEIVVRHAHALEGRPSWRRYYYDSRNLIWLAIRCYPFRLALKRLIIDLSALLIYAIRDGYKMYYFRGIRDGLLGARRVVRDRIEVSKATIDRYKLLEKKNPSFIYMIRKRIFRRTVNI